MWGFCLDSMECRHNEYKHAYMKLFNSIRLPMLVHYIIILYLFIISQLLGRNARGCIINNNNVIVLQFSLFYIIHTLLLLQYTLDPKSGLFSHYEHPPGERRWLSAISFENGIMNYPKTTYLPAPSFEVINCQ